jgi:hypothetical protein
MFLARSWLAGAAAFGLTAALSAAASAAVATVDGVSFTTGIVAGGNTLEVATLSQTGITGPGQQLQGVGLVQAITDGTGVNTVWQNGQNGVELAFEYTGYTSNVVTAPTAGSPGSITYTGGQIGYYVLPAGSLISSSTVGGAVAAVEGGTLFLSETASVEDSQGDTLVQTIPANSTLTSFSAGSAPGFLDVAGGPASAYFNTNTFANPFDTANGGFADTGFTDNFSTGSTAGGFSQSGSATFRDNATAVPEPTMLGVLALGTALLACRRRGAATRG